MMSWTDLTKSPFFQWFGITETRRSPENGGLSIWCKPGGYQDAIDLVFHLDAGQQLRGAELGMERAWMDDRATAPFAFDITKSFVQLLGMNDPAVEKAGEQFEQVMKFLPGVIVRTGGSPDPAPVLDPAVAELHDAFAGRRDRAELRGESSVLSIGNGEAAAGAGPAAICRIVWQTEEAPRRPWWRRLPGH